MRVDSRNSKPVFVGVARSKDVEDYLGATDLRRAHRRRLLAVRAELPRAHRPRHRRSRPRGLLDRLSRTGRAPQTLNWEAEDGKWSVVVMNADGSRGVDAGVSAGAKIDWLGPVGWALVGVGTLMLAGDRARGRRARRV